MHKATIILLLVCFLFIPMLAQGPTLGKHCDYRNPNGKFVDVELAIQAWNNAIKLGAPNNCKWARQGLIIWHPRWNYSENENGDLVQRWGASKSELQIDKKGRISICEYIDIWIPEEADDTVFIEILTHEYLHLIWARRYHLEPAFQAEQIANEDFNGEKWVRSLLD